MAGPWERYGAKPAEAGPWTRYAPAQDAGSDYTDAEIAAMEGATARALQSGPVPTNEGPVAAMTDADLAAINRGIGYEAPGATVPTPGQFMAGVLGVQPRIPSAAEAALGSRIQTIDTPAGPVVMPDSIQTAQRQAIEPPRPDRTLGELGTDIATTFRNAAREGVTSLAKAPVTGINAVNTGFNSAADALAGVFGQTIPADQRVAMMEQPGFVQALEAAGNEINANDYRMGASGTLQYDDTHLPATMGDTLRYLARNPSSIVTDLSRTAGSMLPTIVPGATNLSIGLQATEQAQQAADQVEANLLAKGATSEEAAAAASEAFTSALGVGVVAPRMFEGGTALERFLTGTAARGEGSAAARILTPLAGEMASEATEEGAVQAVQNAYAGDPLGQGVGAAATKGGLLGLLMGGAPAAVEGVDAARARAPAEAPAPEFPQAPAPTAAAPLPAPVLDTQHIADALSAAPESPLANVTPESIGAVMAQLASRPEPAPAAQQPTTGQPVQASAPQPAPAGAGAASTQTVPPQIPASPPPAGNEGQAQPTITATEASPAPEPEAPTRGDPLTVRNEIGWLQQGGRMLRAQPDEAAFNDEERSGAVDQPRGKVIGRTQWQGHPNPQGNESTLWRNRPDKRLKPEQANAVLDKFAAGEKLSPIEQRFVDYAADVAGEYERAEQALQAETDAYTRAERAASIQALRDEVTDLADADQGEALNVYELAHRAAVAGVPEMDIAPFAGETQPAYAARLWNLIAEHGNGADTGTAEQDRQEGGQRREGGPAREEQPVAEEPDRPADEQRGAAAPQEVSRPGQGGLFASPTARETVEAEQRRRDDERNGKAGTGRTDMAAGRGELFAGPRPEQADIETPVAPAPEPASASTEEPARVTGTKNAITDAERAAAGRSPIVAEAAKGNEETLAEAVQALQDDPTIGAATVAKLSRAGVEGISLADEAMLLVHKTDLLNKRDAAAQKLADPKVDEDAKEVARQAWEAAEAEITAIDLAAKNAGREWGRFGQFRQRMLREDFTFSALERKERARLERPLTAEESATIKAMAAQIETLQQRVDELQAKTANAESEWALDRMTRHVVRQAPNRDRLTTLRAAADAARKRLRETADVPSKRGQSGAVISPAVFADLATIGAYHIANGAVTLVEWVKAVTAEVGEWFADLKDDHFNLFTAAKREVDNFADPVDEVLAKIGMSNITAKDVRRLIAAHVGAGVRGEKAVIEAAAKDLGLAEDEVRALFVESARREQTLTEAQQELADLRKLVRLQEEIDRLEAGRPKPEPGKPQQDSAAVVARKQELADLRQRLRPVRDPEGRYQEMRGKQIAKRIEELQARIANGDFAPRPRIPRALTEANQRAMYELDKAKEAFLRHQFEDSLRKRTPVAKAFGVVGDVFNLARAVMTSFDLSAVLRQGGFITYGHPLRALNSIGPSLRAFVSEANEHKTNTEISNRKNAPLYKKFGLQLTGIGAGPLTQIEEAYASRWLSKLPWWTGAGLVRGSGRAYVAFLNKLRADSFDAMVATLAKGAVPTDKEGKAIASYINVATGRGKVGTNETAAQTLNTVFFAPRLVASRFQLLAGQPLYGGTARTRKLVAQEYARFLLGLGVVVSLTAFALGAGDDDEDKPMIGVDPRSSDFGKIRIGKTYLDPLSGLAQVTVLLSRLATGETVSGSGAVKPLRPDWTLTDLRRALGEDLPAHKLGEDGKLPFGSGNAAEVIGRFLRTKLAPVPGAIVNALAGSNVIGDQVTPAQAAGELVVPMSFQNIGDIMEESGIAKGTAITLLGLLGMGIQHRGTDEAQATKESLGMVDDAKAEIEDRLATLPMDQWAGELDKMKEKYGPLLEGVSLAIYKKDSKYGKVGEPKRTSTGAPVLAFEGKDGEGSVLGELDGYPEYGAKGAYITQGVNDRIESLRKAGNRLAGDQELTRDAVVKMTVAYQMQVPAALALFDAVQADGDGEKLIDRKTRDVIAAQMKFLRKAEMDAGARIVDEAKGGKAPDYNRAKSLVQQAVDKEYGQ